MEDQPDIDSLGIKALKELIVAAGLSTEDCIDKADLRARAREALAAKAANPKPTAASTSALHHLHFHHHSTKDEVIGTTSASSRGHPTC